MLTLRARRAFSYTASFLESIDLKPAAAKEDKPPVETVKFSIKDNNEFKDKSQALSEPLADYKKLHEALPGYGLSNSRKLMAHIATVNPTYHSLVKEQAKAREWVHEFLNPDSGPKSKSPKVNHAADHPGAVSVASLKAFQRQIAYAQGKTKSSKRKISQFDKQLLKIDKADFSDIKFYPGSEMGPDPADDPENWVNWFINNQPKSLYSENEHFSPQDIFLSETGPIKDDIINEDEGNEEEDKNEFESEFLEDDEGGEKDSDQEDGLVYDPSYQGPSYPVDSTPETFLTTEFDYETLRKQMPDREFFDGDEPGDLVMNTPMADVNHLPLVPKDLSLVHEEAVMDIDRWAVFRMMPILLKHKAMLPGYLEKLLSKPDAPMEIAIPSLIPYFETLPLFFRELRMIQGFVTGMERYKPEMTRLQKEEMLNKLCYYMAPKDSKRLLFLQEHFYKKYMPTQEELETGGDKGEMDFETKKRLGLVEETAEMKVLKILGEESATRNEEVIESKGIVDLKLDWYSVDEENTKGKLPITLTYYDNDDGYWNQWIKYKRDRNGGPEIVDRKYFRH